MPSIYRKTAKGQGEIETRAHRLPPRLRTALIMVDGKRTEAELRPLLMPTPEETLAVLLAQGFIEVLGSAAPATPAAPAAVVPKTPAPDTARAPAPAATPLAESAQAISVAGMRPMPVPLPTLQRDAVRLLTDQVGPMAESVALRIERSRSSDELLSAVKLGAQIIANTRGRQAAEAYVARFSDI